MARRTVVECDRCGDQVDYHCEADRVAALERDCPCEPAPRVVDLRESDGEPRLRLDTVERLVEVVALRAAADAEADRVEPMPIQVRAGSTPRTDPNLQKVLSRGADTRLALEMARRRGRMYLAHPPSDDLSAAQVIELMVVILEGAPEPTHHKETEEGSPTREQGFGVARAPSIPSRA